MKAAGMNARELSRAIRAKCLECSGGMRAEVRGCRLKDCPLWPHRGTGETPGASIPTTVMASKTVKAGLAGQMDISDVLKGATV